jgi:hypothetical protein
VLGKQMVTQGMIPTNEIKRFVAPVLNKYTKVLNYDRTKNEYINNKQPCSME